VLTQFEAAGLVSKHNFEGGQAVFELDLCEQHDHMVCVETGKVIPVVDAEIEKRQQKIANERGFELQDHALALYANCTRKNCEHRRG
jgi:Fur family ferric uptake transcriptional regulator